MKIMKTFLPFIRPKIFPNHILIFSISGIQSTILRNNGYMSSKSFSDWYKDQKDEEEVDEEMGLLGGLSTSLNSLQTSFSEHISKIQLPNS